MKLVILTIGLTLAFAGCSKKDDKKDVKATGGGGLTQTCRAPLADDHNSAGCKITLVSPTNCAEIDLTDGKTAVFEFKAEGADCRLPFTGHLAGHPVTRDENDRLGNVLSRNDMNFADGKFELSAANFEGLTSDDGTYDWLIENNLTGNPRDGTGPASAVIRVKK